MADQEFMEAWHQTAADGIKSLFKVGPVVTVLVFVSVGLAWLTLDQRAEIDRNRKEAKAEIQLFAQDLRECNEARSKQDRQLGELSAKVYLLESLFFNKTNSKK